jgi:positive regulator of sigma E activity
MKKLILILLAFLAVFTYIRTLEKAEAGQPEIPVEFIR